MLDGECLKVTAALPALTPARVNSVAASRMREAWGPEDTVTTAVSELEALIGAAGTSVPSLALAATDTARDSPAPSTRPAETSRTSSAETTGSPVTRSVARMKGWVSQK